MLSSSDEFSVATPDETAGKDTEFSLVGCFRNKYYLHSMCRDSAKLTNPRRR